MGQSQSGKNMAIKRSEQIDPENAGYYHLISRCVRRAFLCGEDPETGTNYDYRRQWIEDCSKVTATNVFFPRLKIDRFPVQLGGGSTILRQ